MFNAAVVGSAAILFDPMFQGLVISLMAGGAASLFPSRVAVPVLVDIMRRHALRPSPRTPAADGMALKT
jgi:hypothetical protein